MQQKYGPYRFSFWEFEEWVPEVDTAEEARRLVRAKLWEAWVCLISFMLLGFINAFLAATMLKDLLPMLVLILGGLKGFAYALKPDLNYQRVGYWTRLQQLQLPK